MTGSPHPVPSLSADYGQTNTNTQTDTGDTEKKTKTKKILETGKGDARGKGGFEVEPAITVRVLSAPTQSAAPPASGSDQTKVVAKLDTEAEEIAQLKFSTSLQHAHMASSFVASVIGGEGADIAACLKIMVGKVSAVQRGDLREVEEMLLTQAVTLNAVFIEMLRRVTLNIGEHLPATESYMRLGLKAQAQCRVTLETLAEIKNPRPVFARQANFVAGNQQVNNAEGPQQVNNGPARATNSTDDPTNKVLETP